MVVSKRCKVCTALNDDNIILSGQYFDKSLPILVEKISGIRVDAHKANGVMICKLCATQLLHADIFIEKLRNTLQRLTKVVKETKTKTTNSKDFGANTNSDESKLKRKTTVVRRKSTVLDVEVNRFDIKYGSKENTDANNGSVELKNHKDTQKVNSSEVVEHNSELQNNEENGQIVILKSDSTSTELKNVLDSKETSANSNCVISTNELNKQAVQRAKTLKKLVRRKSVIPEENIADKDYLLNNSEILNTSSTPKFRKIADDEPKSTKSIKAQPAKRKQIIEENNYECSNKKLNKTIISEPTPAKRLSSLSISGFEGNTLDMDTDETHFTDSYNGSSLAEGKIKILNCVICGKGFAQKASLREHIESCHMGEKLKQCPNCSTEFRSQQKYESHLFSEKCKNFKLSCQYPKCNRRFKTVHKMEMHMHEKHSSRHESEVEQN